MSNKKSQFEKFVDIKLGQYWANRGAIKAPNNPPEGYDSWEANLREKIENEAKLLGLSEDDDEDDGHSFYSKEEVRATLAQPQFTEYAVHWMGLPGYIYRNLKQHPTKTKKMVYELARLTRDSGAYAFRTFLINGSRKASERYMMDALPWKMKPEGGVRKIDFSIRNQYYFDCLKLIDEACAFWHIVHRPTYWMNMYNKDVFDERFNFQGVHGYRSDQAQKIKIQFMIDYTKAQVAVYGPNYNPTLEIENEPNTIGNRDLGSLLADQYLEMFRALEPLGLKIENTWVCNSMSDFVHANFVGKHYFHGRYFGSDEFKDRKVKSETHSASTVHSLQNLGFPDAWGAWPNICLNEDGANDGSYNPIPWTQFRLGNYQEVKMMVETAIRETKARRKTFYFTMFMMDCLTVDPDDGVPKETYDRINADRLYAYPDAAGGIRA